MKGFPKSISTVRATTSELTELLHRLVRLSPNPERLVELYYWSVEPELAAFMRQYISLPDEPRNALLAFLAMTADCAESVRVMVTLDGQITLSSPVVSKLMAKMAAKPVSDAEPESMH